MRQRFWVLFSVSVVLLAALLWVLFKLPNATPAVAGQDQAGETKAPDTAKPLPKLTSQMTALLPTYSEPLDDFPPNWEEGYGDLSDKGMRRVWREMGAGELPEYVQPINGYHRARLDEVL